MLTVLRRRNFALLWTAGLTSYIGNSMLYVALPFYVYARTGSALATGAIFMIQILPSFLFGSIAGVFVDRWNRQRTMIVADLTRALLILPILAVHSNDWLWLIYVVAALEQFVSLFFGPANRAIIPHLVAEQHLMTANALMGMSVSATRLIGPALGGALMGFTGLSTVIVVDSLTYLVSAALLSLMILPLRASGAPDPQAGTAPGRWTTFWREWLEGLNIVRTDRSIIAIFLVSSVAMVADSVVLVLLIPFVQAVLGLNAQDYGWMQTAVGIGAVTGSLVIGSVGRYLPAHRLLVVAIGAVGVLTFILANSRSLLLILGLLAVLGLPVTGWMVSLQSLLQSAVPDQYRGRVFGAYDTTTTLFVLCGMGLGGALAGRLGIVLMLEVAGSLYILAMVVGLVLRINSAHERVPTGQTYSGRTNPSPNETLK